MFTLEIKVCLCGGIKLMADKVVELPVGEEHMLSDLVNNDLSVRIKLKELEWQQAVTATGFVETSRFKLRLSHYSSQLRFSEVLFHRQVQEVIEEFVNNPIGHLRTTYTRIDLNASVAGRYPTYRHGAEARVVIDGLLDALVWVNDLCQSGFRTHLPIPRGSSL